MNHMTIIVVEHMATNLQRKELFSSYKLNGNNWEKLKLRIAITLVFSILRIINGNKIIPCPFKVSAVWSWHHLRNIRRNESKMFL